MNLLGFMVRPGWELPFPCRAVLLFRFAVHLFVDTWALAVFQPPIDGIGAYPPAYANFAGGKISTQDHILYGARVYARHPDGISTACAAHISILDVECQHVVHPPSLEAGGFLPRAECGRKKL